MEKGLSSEFLSSVPTNDFPLLLWNCPGKPTSLDYFKWSLCSSRYWCPKMDEQRKEKRVAGHWSLAENTSGMSTKC